MRKFILITFGAMLVALGLLAVVPTDEGAWLRILPAFPIAMISTWFDPSARHGLLWDSAHSPPFLNALGLMVIYFLPGVAFMAMGLFYRVRPRIQT